MRTVMALLVLTTMASGPAAASSFVTAEPVAATIGSSIVAIGGPGEAPAPFTPSIITLSGPRPGMIQNPSEVTAAPSDAAGPSFIALGMPAPELDVGKVAAIPERKKSSAKWLSLSPMVIRGGLIGDAFAKSDPKPEEKQTASSSAASEDDEPRPASGAEPEPQVIGAPGPAER